MFVALVDEYADYMEDDMDSLPKFPLQTPADFQILESDSKLDGEIVNQLRRKFQEYGGSESDLLHFLNANLSGMLTENAALPFSWNGLQGNIAIMNFKTIEVLIG